jgi:hypothetical protein
MSCITFIFHDSFEHWSMLIECCRNAPGKRIAPHSHLSQVQLHSAFYLHAIILRSYEVTNRALWNPRIAQESTAWIRLCFISMIDCVQLELKILGSPGAGPLLLLRLLQLHLELSLSSNFSSIRDFRITRAFCTRSRHTFECLQVGLTQLPRLIQMAFSFGSDVYRDMREDTHWHKDVVQTPRSHNLAINRRQHFDKFETRPLLASHLLIVVHYV